MPKSVRHLTTFTAHSTTTSPQKNHNQTLHFLKTPSKNAISPQTKKGDPATAEPPS